MQLIADDFERVYIFIYIMRRIALMFAVDLFVLLTSSVYRKVYHKNEVR